ncbi:LacI family DNA-binding transcriptional regulator [Phytohabitans rumicis]|uniref:LacI family DNA-binding transcriptional regulator n=1 Tax=Phytohabitans rumicis TaxID=1076125 RepID=UPI00156398DC|nr:substrate-binding domain-containing protein [Phytohabitans rumicis]
MARLAGVSRQTVSNVLNGRAAFSRDTESRVLAAMEALAYKPSRAAQTMRSRRTRQLGYHMSGEQLEVMRGFTLGFVQALVKAAAQHEHQIVVFTHLGDDPEPVFRDLIARRSVDAYILDESRVDDARVRLLAAEGVPFACFGRTAPGLPQQWVDVDNVAGMLQLVEYLVAAGHRDYAYVGAGGGEYWKRERLEGLRLGLAQHGMGIAEDKVFEGTDGEIRRWVGELVRGQRPTVIVTSSDAVAVAVVNSCHAAGLRVGRDVAVTGFDGGAVGLLTEPMLTSVRIPVDRIARELVARCLAEISSGPTGRPGLLVPTELAVGGSA